MAQLALITPLPFVHRLSRLAILFSKSPIPFLTPEIVKNKYEWPRNT